MSERPAADQPSKEFDRRAFVKRMAAVAFAIPVVASFKLDSLAQAAPSGDDGPEQYFGNQTLPGHHFPNQTFPNQTFPNQTFPNQTFPNQTFPNQTFPNQTFPNQHIPPRFESLLRKLRRKLRRKKQRRRLRMRAVSRN